MACKLKRGVGMFLQGIDLTSRTGVGVLRGIRWRVLVFALLLLLLAPAREAAAETLHQALVSAYMSSPTLNAQRSALRATDESITQAKSGFRPRASASGDYGYRNFNSESRTPDIGDPDISGGLGGGADGSSNPRGYALTLTQPLFSGFRTVNGVREAKANVYAGREGLRSTEQAVLLNAVTAYMDVVRDQAIVRLQENNVKVLTEQLTATRDRFEVGEVTRTDVSQAEASRAGSISQLSAAQGALQSSRAVYEQVIGHPPSNLVEPSPMESGLPRRLPEALSIADAENPDILQALFLEEAARYVVKQIIGETLPQVDVEAQYNKRHRSSRLSEYQEETTVVGRVTVPLYSGGEPSARARAARHTVQQRKREIDNARTVARANVVAAWSQLTSARAQIESDQSQVRAQQIALNGVREEEKVGQRTVLDVLDAEQDLLDAQVSLVQTRRDLVVASFSLYSAVGRLDAASLQLPVDYYDPEEHFERVKSKWIGFGRKEPNYDAGYGEPRYDEGYGEYK